MEEMLYKLQQQFPAFTFRAGRGFYWSPGTNEIFYRPGAHGPHGVWSLLHETSHALLGHSGYGSDFELVRLEAKTWERTKQLAAELGVTVNEDHIQDCLDTYRDWLHGRSICPRCGNKSVQQPGGRQYRCFNCHMIWRVSTSRFCRTYRAADRDARLMSVFAEISPSAS